jgi:acyl carrier protein
LAALRQASGRPHAIVLPATEAQGPVLSALFAAPVHVASVLTHPASGLPLTAGWLTDQRDVGVCGQPLVAGLEIVDARGRAVGVNAPGHLASDAARDLCLRWRADGQLQCLNLATVDTSAPPAVASIAAAAPTASPPVTQVAAVAQPAQAQAPVASAPASSKAVASSPETILIGIWQNLLGVNGIGPQDNFFELGGNSLLAMVAVDETRKALGVEIDARRFVYETLAQIAASAAPASSGSPSANDAPQCPPASPDRGAVVAASNEGAGAKRKGWLDRARDLLGPRTGTDDPR